MKYAMRLSIFTLLICGLMSYWGIRAPDSEVVFRTTQALATQGTFAVSDSHYSWEGFGLPKGKDGKRYSLFGPGEAIAAVPFYKMAELLQSTGWYRNTGLPVGISHYTSDNGLLYFVNGDTPPDRGPHALRMGMSLLNIILAALCVFVFFCTIKALTRSDRAALFTGILLAFGSLLLPYSGTCFSELLATFFAMLSFYLLVYTKVVNHFRSSLYLWLSGLFLGLAAATHITAVLFVPFFGLYGAFADHNNPEVSADPASRSSRAMNPGDSRSILCRLKDMTRDDIKTVLGNAFLFLAGIGPILALLGYFNFIRFGSVFETGHTLGDTPEFGYGVFVAPWEGLGGLLFSAGKGLLFYCPAIIPALILWRPFHRKYRFLSLTILGAALFRLLFIATRSDWHGGFGIGPRLMVMIIPFLLLPLGEWVSKMLRDKNVKAVAAFALLSLVCMAQQIYFSLGEIFSFLHIAKWDGMNQGVDVFQGNFLYLSWDVSPLLHLLKGKRGPLLLNFIEIGNDALWMILVFVSAIVLAIVYFFTLKRIMAKDAVPAKKNKR